MRNIYSSGEEKEFYVPRDRKFLDRAINHSIYAGASLLGAAATWALGSQDGKIVCDSPIKSIEASAFALLSFGAILGYATSFAEVLLGFDERRYRRKAIEDIFHESMEEFPEEANLRE